MELTSHEKMVKITDRMAEFLISLIKEYKVTEAELLEAIKFLNNVGKANEFHMFSDVLGVAVVVDEITHGNDTIHNIEGPLYIPDAPFMTPPCKLCPDDEPGDVLFCSGMVLSLGEREPLPFAILDIWQPNIKGEYHLEPGTKENPKLRARISTDQEGRFRFKTILPGHYQVPMNGHLGNFLISAGRSTWRAAHIHFKIYREGYFPITTMLYMPHDEYIDNDATHSVKNETIVKLEKHGSEEEMKEYGVTKPFYTTTYNFVLKPLK